MIKDYSYMIKGLSIFYLFEIVVYILNTIILIRCSFNRDKNRNLFTDASKNTINY